MTDREEERTVWIMSNRAIETLEVPGRRQWRAWLDAHHRSVSGIWLVYYKRHTGIELVSYDASVEEALCYGWIDSLIRRLDDDRYARKFTPRRPDSRWSTVNRRRYASLVERGLLAAAGIERAPTSRSGDAPRPSLTRLPAYIEDALKTDARAWEFFQQLAPSHRRAYIGWIDSAKRDETKARRLREALRMLAAKKKPGMK
jgi:uncharacterized protein YdeI (YjbR/CyaY-like superfamily)